MPRTLIRITIIVGWLLWLAASWVLFVAFGFGAPHEIVIAAAVVAVLPTLLLVVHRWAWSPVRLRTLFLVAAASALLFCAIVWFTEMEWIGVQAQN